MSKKNKENKASVKELFSTAAYFYKVIARKYPSYIVYNILRAVFAAAMTIIMIFLPKLLIDEFQGARDPKTMILIAVILGGAYYLCNAGTSICQQQYEKRIDAINRHFNELHKQKCASMDFDKTEDPEVLNLSEKAQQGLDWYGGIDNFMRCFSTMIFSAITIATTGAIIVMGNFIAVIIAAVCVALNYFFLKKEVESELEFNESYTVIDRKYWYNFWQVYDFKYGKDIRLYKGADMLDKNCSQLVDEGLRLSMSYFRKQTLFQGANAIVNTLSSVVPYLIFGVMAIKKLVTIGNFTMYGSATTSLAQSLSLIAQSFNQSMRVAQYLTNYLRFMNLNTDSDFGNDKIDEQGEHKIEFRDVWFKYPRSDEYILKGISITLNKGDKLSVVGLNGAGKTTFIKLLCRFYKVTRGEILIDGKNINDYDFDEYTRLFSVVFQDYKLLSFSFAENIAVEESYDAGEVDSLVEKVGLKDKIDSLPDGRDTVCFKAFDKNGVEPSGGEQQKLSIARALYKDAPVVILDEPTAALDPMAEYEIYKQFDDFTDGKTAIYISHRLSSCRFCDRIAVFADGIIKELGSHDELVEISDGYYRKMFDAQAKYYVKA